MQLAKVVITSALILLACAEGLPEGKMCCILMYTCKITCYSCYAIKLAQVSLLIAVCSQVLQPSLG